MYYNDDADVLLDPGLIALGALALLLAFVLPLAAPIAVR